jgi:hypothetical protein
MRAQVFRHSYQDGYLVGLSLLHLIALVIAPSIPLIAVGVWWNSNTISHHFLHLPFFGSNRLNRAYSLYLTALLGIPQSVWKERHHAHHRGLASRPRWTSAIATEIVLLGVLYSLLVLLAPRFFLTVYLPGIAMGLVLCYLHGYFEHAGGTTTSNYGVLYNFVFFNDGFHVEHHERPSQHWTRMREIQVDSPTTSRWPAVLRWVELFNLETLERIVLRSGLLQAFMLRTHLKALQGLLKDMPVPETIVIVGGGMYPRTAILMRRLFPGAHIRIVDSNLDHLEMAQAFVDSGIRFVHARFRCDSSDDSDLLVVPLSFSECRETIYRNPPARVVLVHDWIWNGRGRSAIVSLLLLKRLNLILR